MRELHFLRLFAYHDEQDDAEKNSGRDQHLCDREVVVAGQK